MHGGNEWPPLKGLGRLPERRPPDIRQPVCSYRQGIPSRTRAELRSTQDGEDGAHEQDDNRDPYEEVSAAHGGRSDAAEPDSAATIATTMRTSA